MPTTISSKPSPEKSTSETSSITRSRTNLSDDQLRILAATHHDPFAVLGRHELGNNEQVLVFIPHAREVFLADLDTSMSRIEGSDFFRWQGEAGQLPSHYQIEWYDHHGRQHLQYDPYCFAAQLQDFDLHIFNEGKHKHAYRILGAHPHSVEGIDGVLFATWAPNAARVSVIGNFNHWDGRCHAMRNRGGGGVWELFIPQLQAGEFYKFEIRSQQGQILVKADPYGNQFEVRPKTAAVVTADSTFAWRDETWMTQRTQDDWLHQPMSIYEVHLGSWQRDPDNHFYSYRELAHSLVDYVSSLGFTHIELLPVTEHPLDASWGYQTTGYFAPTSRFGTPDDFRYFVNYCHEHNIGVLMDWAPGHFPRDEHALARFDGSALYEHADPRKGEHRDWGTLIFNYGRNEVKSFLISNATYWFEEFHIDGLRVDAVASMLYLDYSRQPGDWEPNMYGGNENLEAIDFIRELNSAVHGDFPGALVIAEESTAWPQVTRPTYVGGLGFSMKWNMGWMHDTLVYFSKDPVHRHYHHDQLTFGLMYAFTENFMLPFSHDEVVHGKASMLNKMPGDEWQKFANLRLLYTYMFTYPGKKLLFMGSEFGQGVEWNFDAQLDWYVLEYEYHRGVQKLVSDLNHLYRQSPELYQHDFTYTGFEWIDCHDSAQSVVSYIRKSDHGMLVVVLNFTPVVRDTYRIGVPVNGRYREIFNSDSEYYAGGNVGSGETISTDDLPWMNRPYSMQLKLPPLAGIVLQLDE